MSNVKFAAGTMFTIAVLAAGCGTRAETIHPLSDRIDAAIVRGTAVSRLTPRRRRPLALGCLRLLQRPHLSSRRLS